MAKKMYLDAKPESAYFTLLGISCHLKDYRLSFLLNQNLGFSFIKWDDLTFSSYLHEVESGFSFYRYHDEERLTTYHLIANRSEEFALVPENKQLDFLLFLEGKATRQEKDSLVKAIRSIQGVLTVFEIRLTEIRNYEILLTDIEMHVMNILKTPKTQYQPH